METTITRRSALGSVVGAVSLFAKPHGFGPFGLEIYSLRGSAEKDLPGTLSLIRQLGFKEVEVSSLYGRTASEFRRLLNKEGLQATSMMADYERLAAASDAVAADARTLGADYVVCSTIPHHKQVTRTEIDGASVKFNQWGEKLSKSGLNLCYHTHGVEFGKSPDGTLFDTLVRRTNPKYVNYEMDIFWIVFAHQDPASLLRKYPGRFPLMHVKDIRKGMKLVGTPGDVLEEDSVILGAGIVDIPSALRAAAETGTRHYYIEDEAVDAARQIPESLKYLDGLKK